MAVGDSDDMLARLKTPLRELKWWNWTAPIADAVRGGVADSLSWCYSFYAYAQAQTRISTATEFNLDIISWDFLGTRIKRRPGQSDDSFRAVIKQEIFRPRATRPAMAQAITDLTGTAPIIFEPWNPRDTGVYGRGSLAWSTVGRYGSLQKQFQCWIDVQRPLGQGIPAINGWGGSAGGYGSGRMEWASLSLVTGPVTDNDIYMMIEAIRPAGVTCWTRISDQLPPTHLLPNYDYLLSTTGDRLVLQDDSGIILDGPAEPPPTIAAGSQPAQAKGMLAFDDATQSAQIASVWPF